MYCRFMPSTARRVARAPSDVALQQAYRPSVLVLVARLHSVPFSGYRQPQGRPSWDTSMWWWPWSTTTCSWWVAVLYAVLWTRCMEQGTRKADADGLLQSA